MRVRGKYDRRSGYSVSFLNELFEAGSGARFIAKGVTLRVGRKQVFATAELFAEDEQYQRTLVATGQTLLVPLP